MILSIHKKLSMLKKFEYAWTKFWGSRWTRHLKWNSKICLTLDRWIVEALHCYFIYVYFRLTRIQLLFHSQIIQPLIRLKTIFVMTKEEWKVFSCFHIESHFRLIFFFFFKPSVSHSGYNRELLIREQLNPISNMDFQFLGLRPLK